MEGNRTQMKILRLLACALLLFPAHVHAQREHTSRAHFLVDSIDIHLVRWRTQSADEDSFRFASEYVEEYFSLENDTLYAELPADYVCYDIVDPLTGGIKRDKVMVTYVQGVTTTYFRASTLLGQRTAICATKRPAVLFLSL